MTTRALSYAIDENDHLVKVDQGYYSFAEENGWTEAGTSLGRSLWDYVAGEDLKKVQRLLLRRVRDVGDVELPFRCDGPGVRREMEIRILARPGGRAVLFSARLRSEEERDAYQPLLDTEAARGLDTLGMCGWCDRFEVDEGEWVEVEEAARRLGLFERTEMPTLSHGICPDCKELLLAA